MQQQAPSLPSPRPQAQEQPPHCEFPQQLQPPATSVFDVLRQSIVSGQIQPSPAEAAQIYTMLVQYGASQETLSDMAHVLQQSAAQATNQIPSSPSSLPSSSSPSVAATGGLLDALNGNVGVIVSPIPTGQALRPPISSYQRFVKFLFHAFAALYIGLEEPVNLKESLGCWHTPIMAD
ncbi:hypothetical protein HDU87_005670 [Geranomyces variabilis]|uniref:Uncharacterized protein n=1 Tax=Geranomyces variabilis TaxID=109894 RepID=A0AAD5XPG6_9FUNG|nr:hypothetical protein HDU87_005670 [Geranomyces variabilis]